MTNCRPGFEPSTSEFRATTGPNEPSGRRYQGDYGEQTLGQYTGIPPWQEQHADSVILLCWAIVCDADTTFHKYQVSVRVCRAPNP